MLGRWSSPVHTFSLGKGFMLLQESKEIREMSQHSKSFEGAKLSIWKLGNTKQMGISTTPVVPLHDGTGFSYRISFPVGFLPRSVHWRNFAQLKQRGYGVKYAVVPGLDSKPRENFQILRSPACHSYSWLRLLLFPLRNNYWVVAVGEWVAVGKQRFLAIYGSERHVMKRGGQGGRSTAVVKLVESCTMGWITSLPSVLILYWQVAPARPEANEAASATACTN